MPSQPGFAVMPATPIRARAQIGRGAAPFLPLNSGPRPSLGVSPHTQTGPAAQLYTTGAGGAGSRQQYTTQDRGEPQEESSNTGECECENWLAWIVNAGACCPDEDQEEEGGCNSECVWSCQESCEDWCEVTACQMSCESDSCQHHTTVWT